MQADQLPGASNIAAATEFWIDVGGTFTDCLARSPDGGLRTLKVLSSGATKGRVASADGGSIVDPLRFGDATDFWAGYEFRRIAADGSTIDRGRVVASETATGRLQLDRMPAGLRPGERYELASDEEAPIVAIRAVLGLRLTDPIPPVTVKLGTTRGTNALLTRSGARTALVANVGFADVLPIGNQDRPRLFDLAPRRPEPLFERAVEVAGRIDATGREISPFDEDATRRTFAELKSSGIEAVAICLMNAYANGEHEARAASIAREFAFADVSVSSEIAPRIKLIPRGDTTVVDAYLNPVLRGYVDRLRASLLPPDAAGGLHSQVLSTLNPQLSTLKVMSSAGGLLAADRFTGKDSILSGPAGGVVGFSRIAERAGFPRAIGFDMGGTSTDVSRYDGTYDLEFESTKAGVRLAAPMLAIETVAAGGGSVCRFDGVKLAVGPQSAGADPGPACYGRGGPLTVTDVNLALGRILADRFPFPLDRDAVERRLAALCDDVAASPLGRRYTPVELAAGFRTIAIEAMARAIRTVSIARGFDPADYTLVTFGGAGGQHACELAAVLGIGTVLAHPHAGVLSAYGIGIADVRRFGEKAVLKPLMPEIVPELDAAFDELARQGIADVIADGIDAGQIDRPRKLLDLRYLGTETPITIEWPEDREGKAPAELSSAFQRSEVGDLVSTPADRAAQAAIGTASHPLTPDPSPQGEGNRSRSRQGALATRQETQSAASPIDAVLDDFAAQHRRQYGYVRHGKPVECTAVRVEVVGRIPVSETPEAPVEPRTPEATEATIAVFDGVEQSVPVFDRTALRPGDRLAGPAIVFEPTSTFVLDPGWSAEMTARGDLVAVRETDLLRGSLSSPLSLGRGAGGEGSELTSSVETVPPEGLFSSDVEPTKPQAISSPLTPLPRERGTEAENTEQVDPVRLELFNNLFASIAEQMGEVLRRTSLSTNVKERLDYSCAIFDDEGRLVVNAPHIPVHLGAMGETVKAVLVDNPDFAPGDVVVTNDPYRGGSHLPDVTVVTPVHDAAGRLLFLTASRAHHAEIGGIVPGSMPPFSKSLADEGVLLRNFRLVERGESHEDELRSVLASGPHPSRNPDDNLADIAAQVAANRRGADLLGGLVDRFSLLVVQAYMGHIRRAAGEKIRLALRSRPDGVLTFVDRLDDGSPIAVTITLKAGEATVDFSGTGPVLATNLNANRAIVTAAVLYVFRCLIDEEIPLNGGVLDPVEIVLPECLLNPPAHDDPAECAAIVGGNVETSQRVVDVLLGAFGVAAASQGTMNNLTFGNERFGYYETICGGTGATAGSDGCSGIHSHMTNTRLTDPEVLERRYPVRLVAFERRHGSGGRGRHAGGDGVVRVIEFLEPLSVAMLSERRGPSPPFGLDGGDPGGCGRNRLRRTDGSEVDLGGKFRIDVAVGDRLIIETPGGGGFGAFP